ncbi:hypothetical protein M378DRAFT_162153 [Amanita muscaria Koide BX008]|uniref:Uncharacterized protein n=1 Tax=Amanita muscaria (strain Koide BX008) TaxID=946122 RepID=A0A0C2TEF9_AMAMK|nr:hypothetical protein M378DRAFT_162153 [Amanita muscaria Koide BX008]
MWLSHDVEVARLLRELDHNDLIKLVFMQHPSLELKNMMEHLEDMDREWVPKSLGWTR